MSEPRELRFEMPLPANVANGRVHWRTKYNAGKQYQRTLDNRLLVRILPKAPAQPFAKARAEIEVRTFRIMDRDNATARVKNCLDWLKTRGYIVNDSPDHLALSVEPVKVPKSGCGVFVKLTEVVE